MSLFQEFTAKVIIVQIVEKELFVWKGEINISETSPSLQIPVTTAVSLCAAQYKGRSKFGMKFSYKIQLAYIFGSQ